MKTQGCLLYAGPKYVKTEEIAERKGAIFLHLRECVSVCWCTARLQREREREWEKVRALACMHEKHMEGKWEREGRKRNRPLIRWSQLITFSRPDGRHSSNLWPQPSGPLVLTLQQSPIRRKQAWVYAGRRNRWAWGGRQWSLKRCEEVKRHKNHQNFRETTRGLRFSSSFFNLWFSHGHQKGRGERRLAVSVCLHGCENTTSAPQRVKHQICLLL